MSSYDAAARRTFRDQLYAYLEEYFESARRKEEQAIDNKKTVKQRDKLTPQTLAADVFAEIENNFPDLLRTYRDLAREDRNVPVEGIRIPAHSKAEVVEDMFTTGVKFSFGRGRGEIVRTRSGDQARLVMKIAEMGECGRNHFLPVDAKIIAAQIERIDAHLSRRCERVQELIGERTNDPELQARAFSLAMARF